MNNEKVGSVEEVIDCLKNYSSEKHRDKVKRLGIPVESTLGVSTKDIRKIAKKIGTNHKLAEQLWKTEYHEPRLLAALIANPEKTTDKLIESWLDQVESWDLCDHLCKELIQEVDGIEKNIEKWANDSRVYLKRAVFTLIVALVSDKKPSSEEIDNYIEIIKSYSDDKRKHVKKAVIWALKEIGKMDFDKNEKAQKLAKYFIENGTNTQRSIGKKVLKEIKDLVKVSGREHLVKADSKTAEYYEVIKRK